MSELVDALNDAAGTTGLDAAGAANVIAGTGDVDLDLVGALNYLAGNARDAYRELVGVVNQLAGTTGLGLNAAAAAASFGLFLLTEGSDVLTTEAGDVLVQES